MSVITIQLLIVHNSVLILLVVMSVIVMMATEQLLLMLHSVKVHVNNEILYMKYSNVPLQISMSVMDTMIVIRTVLTLKDHTTAVVTQDLC